MYKVIGFIEMTKRVGKVVFVEDLQPNEKVIGVSCDKLFLYEDISKKITKECIGKTIDIVYNRGYNGTAYVSDVIII